MGVLIECADGASAFQFALDNDFNGNIYVQDIIFSGCTTSISVAPAIQIQNRLATRAEQVSGAENSISLCACSGTCK